MHRRMPLLDLTRIGQRAAAMCTLIGVRVELDFLFLLNFDGDDAVSTVSVGGVKVGRSDLIKSKRPNPEV